MEAFVLHLAASVSKLESQKSSGPPDLVPLSELLRF